MGQTGCSETTVRNYHYSLRDYPEERSTHLLMAKTNSKGFQYLSNKFPKFITAKLKEGILVGPQIRQILEAYKVKLK